MKKSVLLLVLLAMAWMQSPALLLADVVPASQSSAICCCDDCMVHTAQRTSCACAPASACQVAPTLAVLNTATALRSPGSVGLDFALTDLYAGTRTERPTSPPPKAVFS